MSSQNLAYIYAIGSATCFASGSLLFAHFSQKISSVWMNFLKCFVCVVLLSALVFFLKLWEPINYVTLLALGVSGILGLGIGDIFLLKAYARMGAARTLILFGFQPLFIGIASWYFFDQEISPLKFISILFFIGCLWTLSFEKYKEVGQWEIIGLVAALLGVIFDNTGIILTRWSFDHEAQMGPLQANLVRCLGAYAFFVLANPILKARLIPEFKKLSRREKTLALGAAFVGTFLSLCLYLTAVRVAHLASLAAVGVSGPLISSFIECVYYRRWPSPYLLFALALFLSGFCILILA